MQFQSFYALWVRSGDLTEIHSTAKDFLAAVKRAEPLLKEYDEVSIVYTERVPCKRWVAGRETLINDR